MINAVASLREIEEVGAVLRLARLGSGNGAVRRGVGGR
jgi:hypothetical protein